MSFLSKIKEIVETIIEWLLKRGIKAPYLFLYR